MKITTVTLYQIREYIGSNYGKQLGTKLRNRRQAQKLIRYLKKRNRSRTLIASPMTVAYQSSKPDQ